MRRPLLVTMYSGLMEALMAALRMLRMEMVSVLLWRVKSSGEVASKGDPDLCGVVEPREEVTCLLLFCQAKMVMSLLLRIISSWRRRKAFSPSP